VRCVDTERFDSVLEIGDRAALAPTTSKRFPRQVANRRVARAFSEVKTTANADGPGCFLQRPSAATP
jgi:hypothetical protein